MGDMIKKVGVLPLAGTELEVELNHSARGGKYRDIHLQNKKFRLEIPEQEFLQMAACTLLAKRQFDVIKENNHGNK